MKEYGGYLSLELPKLRECFSDIPEQSKLRVNCGRTAFYCAIKASGIRKLYVPHLNCQNSTDPVSDAGVDFEYYNVDENLFPKIDSVKDSEGILIVNYYGNISEKNIHNLCKKFPTVILDLCTGFFQKPILDRNLSV